MFRAAGRGPRAAADAYVNLGNAVFDPFQGSFRRRIQLQFSVGNTF